MPSKIAAKLITGPLAFLLAGIVDLVAYALSRRQRAPHQAPGA